MANYNYKISEAPSPNLAKQIGAKIGDVTYSKDGETRFTVDAVDPESGQVSWKVANLPNFDKLFDEITDATVTAKGVYTKVKDDEKFRDFYEELKSIRNNIRTHLRKEYPEDYKRMTMNESDINAPISSVNLAKANNQINNPSGLADYILDVIDQIKDKEQESIFNNGNIKNAINFLTKAKGVDEISTSGAAGPIQTPYAFKLKKKKKVDEGVGATLGPGPAAGEDGVKDNAYVKQFKYKLVPKNKDGTYVQKGSGLEVKKLY
jgi:hypothetical protein